MKKLNYTHQMWRIFVLCSAAYVYFVKRLISPTGTRRAYVLPQMFFFVESEISELHRPIAVKFCHMIVILLTFIMQVQKFRGPKKRPKTWKFGAISDAFRFWPQFFFGTKKRHQKSKN